jgi:sugar phosphate isomerase/epimerase
MVLSSAPSIPLGIVTDEVCGDFRLAFQIVRELGLRQVELRMVGSSRVPFLNAEDQAWISRFLQETGIRITALSPGTYKCTLHGAEYSQQASIFRQTLDLAERWQVPKVITFAVKRSPLDQPADYQQICDELGSRAEEACRRGIALCAENESGWWNDTLENILRLHRDLAGSGLHLNWDPGNFLDAGASQYTDGYALLKPYIANVHIKDVRKTGEHHEWAPLGEGEVDWAGQLAELRRDLPAVDLTIETHVAPLLINSVNNLQYIRRIIGYPLRRNN